MSLSSGVEAVLAGFERGENRFELAESLARSMGLTDARDLIEKVSEVLGRDLTEREKHSIGELKGIMMNAGIVGRGTAGLDPCSPSKPDGR